MTRISIRGYEPAHLSYSTVSGLRFCGKKFELQKILRLEEKPGLASIGGNAVHTATEDYDLGKWSPSSPIVDIIKVEVEDDDVKKNDTDKEKS